MSPWTDLTASGESYDTNYERDPLFGKTRDSLIYNRDYVGDHDPMDEYISPMFGDFRGFPPMLIQVGFCGCRREGERTGRKSALKYL